MSGPKTPDIACVPYRRRWLYLWACFFQAYWCACQDCPYIGRFCPAIAGIIPASWIARWLYGGGRVERSEPRFAAHAVLAVLGWLGWTVLIAVLAEKRPTTESVEALPCHAFRLSTSIARRGQGYYERLWSTLSAWGLVPRIRP